MNKYWEIIAVSIVDGSAKDGDVVGRIELNAVQISGTEYILNHPLYDITGDNYHCPIQQTGKESDFGIIQQTDKGINLYRGVWHG